MPSFSLRLGKSLHSCYRSYCKSMDKNMSNSQALQVLLIRYMEEPNIYSKLTVRELREPMVFSLSVLVSEKLQKQVNIFAKEHGLRISEVLRFAIYQELMIHGQSE